MPPPARAIPGGILWLAHAGPHTPARPPTPSDPAPTPRDEELMALALDLAARAAEAGEVPVGAVLYETATGAIIAQGANTREARRSPLGHAELAVLDRAAQSRGDWRFNDCTLVVTLEPCPMCAGAILNARVGRVVFGTPDPKAGAVRSLLRLCDDPRFNHRATIVPGVLRERCAAQLSAFFKGLRARRAT